MAFERQKALPVVYEEVRLDCGYRIDLLVEGEVVVEIKAVETSTPIVAKVKPGSTVVNQDRSTHLPQKNLQMKTLQHH